MSATLVTQCPHCQTRFRLSQEHLRAAAGNVRCGACLKVFNATPPTANDKPASETVNALPDRQPRNKTRLDDVLIHDDLELDDLDLEDLGLDESIIDEVNPAPPQQSSLPLASPPAAGPEPISEPRPEPEPEPEPELDIEIEAEPVIKPESGPESKHESARHEPDEAALLLRPDIADPVTPNASIEPDTDQDAAEHGIFLRDQPAAISEPAVPPPIRYSDDLPAYEDTETPLSGLHAERDQREPPKPATKDAVEYRREPLLGNDFMLPELDTDMLLLDDQPITRPRQRSALWTALSLLAVLALIGQFGYFNFAALAHDERSRPLIASWCNVAGCQLPPQVDISLIRSSNLTVRQHPEYPNTLAIDVILYNRADFSQPFPVLRMRFTDQSDREVASRLFRPQEYLGGELAGARLMPAQTPIHVGLSMLAPEQAGSSYRLDFLSPEQ